MNEPIAKLQSSFQTPALAYVARGWWVLPLHSMRGGACSCGHANDAQINGRRHTPGKHPRTPNGLKDASNDPTVVLAWLAQWPDMNVGIATGPSGLYVLDVDPGKGGTDSLNKLLGKVGEQVMQTVLVQTGSGGLHVYWLRPPELDEHNTASLLGPGLDSRGIGGYVVAPPSNHVSGGTYSWATGKSPDEIALLAMPEAIVRELEVARNGKKRSTGMVPHNIGERIPKGRRDSTLLSLASSLRARGVPQAAIETTLIDVNRKLCDPPATEDSVLDVARRYAADLNADRTKLILDAGDHDPANAERLVALFGDNIRFVHEWGWMVWEDTHWAKDTFGRLPHYAYQVARTTQEYAARLEDDDRRKRLLKWAHTSLSVQKAAAMIKAAEGRPDLRATVKDFDRHDLMLNVRNCVIDLKTGRREPHGRDLRITYCVDIEYDPDAKCPLWDKFVEWCCTPAGGKEPDRELMAFLQRCAGYTLTGSVEEHCLFFLFGDGRNGKSVFINILRALVGDLATTLPFGMLLDQKDAKNETALASLAGKRMATAIEGGKETGSFNEELIKSLTGGDKGLRARFLYGDAFFFDAMYKIWLSNNYQPRINGTDEGIWERIHAIPFRNHLPKAQRDKKLEDKLRTELPGILAWAVRGEVARQAEGGLKAPACVLDATRTYREANDVFDRFLEERCTIRPDLKVTAAELLRAYNQFADEQHEKSMTANALGRRVGRARAGLFKKAKSSIAVWEGLCVGPPPHLPGNQETLESSQPDSQHDRMRTILDMVRLLSKNEKGYVTGSRLEQELALEGWSPGDVQSALTTLRRNNSVFPKGGIDTWAPVNP